MADAFAYPNGMPKTSGVAYVAKNTNNPWRVFVPGMEALGTVSIFVTELVRAGQLSLSGFCCMSLRTATGARQEDEA